MRASSAPPAMPGAAFICACACTSIECRSVRCFTTCSWMSLGGIEGSFSKLGWSYSATRSATTGTFAAGARAPRAGAAASAPPSGLGALVLAVFVAGRVGVDLARALVVLASEVALAACGLSALLRGSHLLACSRFLLVRESSLAVGAQITPARLPPQLACFDAPLLVPLAPPGPQGDGDDCDQYHHRDNDGDDCTRAHVAPPFRGDRVPLSRTQDSVGLNGMGQQRA